MVRKNLIKREGFDNGLYQKLQLEDILQRMKLVDRLYLEIGGKLSFDSHASRVLPGYDARVKIETLKRLSKFDLIYCISAIDLAKIRTDTGTSYGEFALDELAEIAQEFPLKGVVITRHTEEQNCEELIGRIKRLGVPLFKHTETENYPNLSDLIGLSKQPFVPTEEQLVIVAGIASMSGKMAVAISQIYNEPSARDASFAKWETFSVWNLDSKHPLNLAIDAAVAHENDPTMMDHHHYCATGISALTYHRDMKNHELLARVLKQRDSRLQYVSPTAMGINHLKEAIVDPDLVEPAARQEIIRRYFNFKQKALVDQKYSAAAEIVKEIMVENDIRFEERGCLKSARQLAHQNQSAASIQTVNGEEYASRETEILTAEAAVLVEYFDSHCEKKFTSVLDIRKALHQKSLVNNNWDSRMTINEIGVFCYTIESDYINLLKSLRNAEMHTTGFVLPDDLQFIRKLGLRMTADNETKKRPNYF